MSEASVHLPKRSRVWQAVFTGPEGGQVWRSTGLTDREQALLVAKQWEREARAEHAKLGRSPRRPAMCVRRTTPLTGTGPLTQREVAMLLNISERAVKAIERRAIQKLRNHPMLREVWQQFLSGELDEDQLILTSEEVEALFHLARTKAWRNTSTARRSPRYLPKKQRSTAAESFAVFFSGLEPTKWLFNNSELARVVISYGNGTTNSSEQAKYTQEHRAHIPAGQEDLLPQLHQAWILFDVPCAPRRGW